MRMMRRISVRTGSFDKGELTGGGDYMILPTQIHMEESMKIFSTNYVFVLQVLLLELDSMSRSRLFG